MEDGKKKKRRDRQEEKKEVKEADLTVQTWVIEALDAQNDFNEEKEWGKLQKRSSEE